MARNVLESEIGRIWLSAEISNFVAASSGHWYFTLKDNRAQIKAAMFRGANSKLFQRPKEGDKVLVRANISLYEPRGDYQLIVEHLEADGEGLLKQQFEQLKQRLAAEGLFAMEHKQALPKNVNKIGIITSPSGAALHDILTVLKRRNPATEVIIYPSQVQGQPATAQIATNIQLANKRDEVDILIVGRGGGSLEDLWCFNEEVVARAIFNSTLPVISAVGHEVDVTIADYVADIRAATPSAAAELASQDQQELLKQSHELNQRLNQAFSRSLQHKRHSIQLFEQKLHQYHPDRQLQQQGQKLDQLAMQLQALMQQKLSLTQLGFTKLKARLEQNTPQHKLASAQQKLAQVSSVLHKNVQQQMRQKQQRLANSSHLLDTVSPLATLGRGYSISFKQGELVTSAKQVQSGDKLIHKLVDGEIHSIAE